jgi:hypothetical protein
MVRMRDRILGDNPRPWLVKMWRTSRANSLALLLGRYLSTPREWAEGRAHLKRIILEDVIADIGWPKGRWLKPRARAERDRVLAFREWMNGDQKLVEPVPF